MSTLTERVRQYNESTASTREEIKDSFDSNPKEFAEMILSSIEDEATDTLLSIIHISGIIDHMMILNICLKEIPWEFHKVHDFFHFHFHLQPNSSNIRNGVFTTFRNVLSSDDMKNNKVTYLSYLVEKRCWIFSESCFREILSQNRESCMKDTVIMNYVLEKAGYGRC